MTDSMKGGFTGYRITREGRVFSETSNWRGYGCREMRQQLNSHGYPSVRILVDGKRKRIAVHRMVAAEYLPPRPSQAHEIRHLDGDKENNSASNLAWGTRKDNADDRARHGRTRNGWKTGNIDAAAHREACIRSRRERHG